MGEHVGGPPAAPDAKDIKTYQKTEMVADQKQPFLKSIQVISTLGAASICAMWQGVCFILNKIVAISCSWCGVGCRA